VSADGWLCPGNFTTPDYSNVRLPDASTPPGMICLNWDDLYPVSGGGHGYVYYYHDAANHRFIVEYDSVAYYRQQSVYDKFQAIVYDTTVTTFSGDNLIDVQYMTADGYTSSTLGIESPNRTIAINGLFDGEYHRGCAPIGPRRVIRYTTDPPYPTAVAESDGMPHALQGRRLAVWPNPLRANSTVAWNLAREGRVSVVIYDAAGRAVRRLVDGMMKAGVHATAWSGRDVAPGIYFCKLTTAQGSEQQKVIVTR
jgi:hypothetical protein